MGNLYLALYKHKRPIKSVKDFVYRISDDLTKILTKGKYSHCEIVIKQKMVNISVILHQLEIKEFE